MLTLKCYAKNGCAFYLHAYNLEQARQRAAEECGRLGTEVDHLVFFTGQA